MSTNDTTPAADRGSECNDLLGLVERLRQQYPATPHHRDELHREAADEIERLRAELARCGKDNCMGRLSSKVTNWVTVQARDAAVAAERERWVFAVRKVIDADNAYGVGFSNTPNWRKAYERLRSMAYEGA